MNRAVIFIIFAYIISFSGYSQQNVDSICFEQGNYLICNVHPNDGYTYYTIKNSGNNGIVLFIDKGNSNFSCNSSLNLKKYLKGIESNDTYIKRKGWNDWTIYNHLEGKIIFVKTRDNITKQVELVYEIE